MLQILKSEENILSEKEEVTKGCWAALTDPSTSELRKMSKAFGIEIDDLRAPLDEEERSRIEVEEGYTMIVVDIPTTEENDEKDWYVTIPLAIFLTDVGILTVCLQETPILTAFMKGRVRYFYSHMKSRFLLQILYRNASLYLQYLRNIDKKSEEIEKKLHTSPQNSELIELLELQKTLVYFTTSLRSNELVLEKLVKSKAIKMYEEDEELLEDVIIENKQAIEMTTIYSGVLNSMMDAFASVISNNLNVVMKFLAAFTVVMSIPTMIAGLYGMNVATEGMPFASSSHGFLIVTLFALLVSVIVAIIFAKKDFF